MRTMPSIGCPAVVNYQVNIGFCDRAADSEFVRRDSLTAVARRIGRTSDLLQDNSWEDALVAVCAPYTIYRTQANGSSTQHYSTFIYSGFHTLLPADSTPVVTKSLHLPSELSYSVRCSAYVAQVAD